MADVDVPSGGIGLAGEPDGAFQRALRAESQRRADADIPAGRIALLAGRVDRVDIDALVQARRNEERQVVADLVADADLLFVLGAVSACRRQAERADRAVVVVPVLRRRRGELVEDPIEPLIERHFDRDGIDHRRRLRERDVRGAQRLGAAPKGDHAGRVEVVPDIEPPVGLEEVVLEVLGRRAGIVAETAGGQQPQRVVQPLRPQLERRTNDRNRRTDRSPWSSRTRCRHIPELRSTDRKQRERADADAKLVSPRACRCRPTTAASGRSTCGVCWSRVCLAGDGVSTWAWTVVAAHDNSAQPRMGVQTNRVRDARIVMGLAGHPGNGASVG